MASLVVTNTSAHYATNQPVSQHSCVGYKLTHSAQDCIPAPRDYSRYTYVGTIFSLLSPAPIYLPHTLYSTDVRLSFTHPSKMHTVIEKR